MFEPSDNRQVATGDYNAQIMGDHNTTTIDVTNITYQNVDRPRLANGATLKVALRQLDRLPLNEVPDPAPLPQGPPVPLSPNPLFVGRDAELKALAKSLKAGDTAAIGQRFIAATTGMGGIGKTQLASEFVHRYGQYFLGGICWLSLADPSAVSAEVAAFGSSRVSEFGFNFATLPLEEKVRRVMSAWQSKLPRLLIFDNCEEEELLDRWRPPTGGCRVLVTSRRDEWSPVLGIRTVALDMLSRDESITLLLRYLDDSFAEDPALDAIAHELGDLPLAIDLAGRYLKRKRNFSVTPEAYLAQLRRPDLLNHPSLREAKGASATHHKLGMARTFAVSYEQLEPKPTDTPAEQDLKLVARKLLIRIAHFAPGEPIGHWLLWWTLKLPDDDPDMQSQAEDALSRLEELGLLQMEEQTVRMHRLVASAVRAEVTDDVAQGDVEGAVSNLIGTLLVEADIGLLLHCMPHLRALGEAAEQREDESAASLCLQLGTCLQMIGSFREAEHYLWRALTISEKTLGEDAEDPVLSITLNRLALLSSLRGDRQEARSLLDRALSTSEKALEAADPYTGVILITSLIETLNFQGARQEMRRLLEQVLSLTGSLKDEDLLTAQALTYVGVILTMQELYEEAWPLFQRSISIIEDQLGEESPAAIVNFIHLGDVLYKQGKYEDARSLFERALATKESLEGEDLITAQGLNSLGSVLYSQGRYEEAQSRFARALAIWEEQSVEENPAIALVLTGLGNSLYSQGRYEEAQPLYQRALAIREKAFGVGHPLTATSLDNLASLLYSQGRYEEARPLYQRALSILETELGENPHTAITLSGLADTLYAQSAGKKADVPSIASWMHEDTASIRYRFAAIVPRLREGEDYELDEEKRQVSVTDVGIEKVEKALGVDNIYDVTNTYLYNHFNEALRAQALFHRDRDYIVRNGRVLVVDEPSSYVFEWKRYSEGLHQAIEAKEGLEIREEDKVEEARRLYQRALAIREKALGERHPLTAASLNNLANSLYSQGRYEEARPLYERALAKREKRLQAVLQAHVDDTREPDLISRGAWRNKVDASLALMRCTLQLGEEVDTMSYVEEVLTGVISKYVSDDVYPEEWDVDTLAVEINRFFPTPIDFKSPDVGIFTSADILAMVLEDARERLEERKAEWEERTAELERLGVARSDSVDTFEEAERRTLLSVVEARWREQTETNYMRGGFDIFQEMERGLKEDYVTHIYRLENIGLHEEEMQQLVYSGDEEEPNQRPSSPRRRTEAKIGRNDPCPCGSGKKYKKCHGIPGAPPLNAT